jgi:hypothetical protein
LKSGLATNNRPSSLSFATDLPIGRGSGANQSETVDCLPPTRAAILSCDS